MTEIQKFEMSQSSKGNSDWGLPSTKNAAASKAQEVTQIEAFKPLDDDEIDDWD